MPLTACRNRVVPNKSNRCVQTSFIGALGTEFRVRDMSAYRDELAHQRNMGQACEPPKADVPTRPPSRITTCAQPDKTYFPEGLGSLSAANNTEVYRLDMRAPQGGSSSDRSDTMCRVLRTGVSEPGVATSLLWATMPRNQPNWNVGVRRNLVTFAQRLGGRSHMDKQNPTTSESPQPECEPMFDRCPPHTLCCVHALVSTPCNTALRLVIMLLTLLVPLARQDPAVSANLRTISNKVKAPPVVPARTRHRLPARRGSSACWLDVHHGVVDVDGTTNKATLWVETRSQRHHRRVQWVGGLLSGIKQTQRHNRHALARTHLLALRVSFWSPPEVGGGNESKSNATRDGFKFAPELNSLKQRSR